MKLHPQWISGFVDGEGTFYIGITKHPEMTAGYQVMPEFRIVQHKRDIQLLYALKSFFKSGVVRINHDDRYELRIRKLDSLAKVIVPFFEKNQLQTKKVHDFIKFRKIILAMQSGMHLSKEGVCEIIRIAKEMNRKIKPVAEQIEKDILGKDIVRT